MGSVVNLTTGELVTSRQPVSLGSLVTYVVVVFVIVWILLAFTAVALEMTPREMIGRFF